MAINLIPYFKSKIGTTLRGGEAEKVYEEKRFATRKSVRYFDLLIIAVDEDANTVFFEGWSGDAVNTVKSRYHGTTSVCLDGRTSVVEVQMIAASQFPVKFDKKEYLNA